MFYYLHIYDLKMLMFLKLFYLLPRDLYTAFTRVTFTPPLHQASPPDLVRASVTYRHCLLKTRTAVVQVFDHCL